MRHNAKTVLPITAHHFDAVLFDLDGVITKTASVHAACWKKLFDDFLRQYAAKTAQTFVPFDIVADYARYVDGKLRWEGVRDFLAARNIFLPPGTQDDPPGIHTIHALALRKDDLFTVVLQEKGVDILVDGLALVQHVRAAGLKTAVVSSSKNCQMVLQMAHIEQLFDIRVDGVTAEQLQLQGKPAPDPFLKAAELLDVVPQRAVVVEDALSGVQSGVRGNFGLVVAVDRLGNAAALYESGADLVVTDLRSLIV